MTDMSPKTLARLTGASSLLLLIGGVVAQGLIANRLVRSRDAGVPATTILAHTQRCHPERRRREGPAFWYLGAWPTPHQPFRPTNPACAESSACADSPPRFSTSPSARRSSSSPHTWLATSARRLPWHTSCAPWRRRSSPSVSQRPGAESHGAAARTRTSKRRSVPTRDSCAACCSGSASHSRWAPSPPYSPTLSASSCRGSVVRCRALYSSS